MSAIRLICAWRVEDCDQKFAWRSHHYNEFKPTLCVHDWFPVNLSYYLRMTQIAFPRGDWYWLVENRVARAAHAFGCLTDWNRFLPDTRSCLMDGVLSRDCRTLPPTDRYPIGMTRPPFIRQSKVEKLCFTSGVYLLELQSCVYWFIYMYKANLLDWYPLHHI